MRRSTLIASAVLLFAGLAIGALWASMSETASRSDDVAAELAALRESEAKRRPTAADKRSRKPALCGKLVIDTYGTVADPSLTELSGLISSPSSPGTMWAIEDSGAEPTFVAFLRKAAVARRWSMPGADNVDWEDIAAGPGPGPTGSMLYAADIGDNDAVRDSISVYRVAEPNVLPADGGSNSSGTDGQTAPAQRLELTYPDGAHDAETLLVDPKRGTLVIVTKGLAGGAAYAVSPPAGFTGKATLRRVGPISVPLATGGDISADGNVVAVRGYFSLSVWRRRGNEPITQTLKRAPCTSPTALSDGQGEAIALSKSGTTAWTVSEATNPKILRLRPQPNG